MKTIIFLLSFILAAIMSSQGQVFTTFGGNDGDTMAFDRSSLKTFSMRSTPTTGLRSYVYNISFDVDSISGYPKYTVLVEKSRGGYYETLHTVTYAGGTDTSFSFTNTTGYHGTLLDGFRVRVSCIDSMQVIKVTNGQFEYWPK